MKRIYERADANMTFKRLTAVLLALLLMAASALADSQVVQPTDDFYVNDSADVLSDEVEGLIVLNNDALYEACGAQIVFVTVTTTGTTDIEDYAYTLFSDWGIGSSEKNNGILVLMAINDDDYWTVQGNGIQDYITAGDLDEMLYSDLEPDFAEKNYSDGAEKLFTSLFNAVAKVYDLDLTVDITLYDEYIATQTDTGDYTADQTETGRDTSSASPRKGSGGFGILLIWLVVIALVIAIIRAFIRALRRGVGMTPPPRRHGLFFFRPRMPHMPPRPRSSGPRPGGFGGGRPSGGSRPSGAGRRSSVSHSVRHSGGFGGGRSGGGGGSRGGGAGRHR